MIDGGEVTSHVDQVPDRLRARRPSASPAGSPAFDLEEGEVLGAEREHRATVRGSSDGTLTQSCTTSLPRSVGEHRVEALERLGLRRQPVARVTSAAVISSIFWFAQSSDS